MSCKCASVRLQDAYARIIIKNSTSRGMERTCWHANVEGK